MTFNCAPYSSSTHDAAIVVATAPYSIGVDAAAAVRYDVAGLLSFFISDNRKGTLREGGRGTPYVIAIIITFESTFDTVIQSTKNWLVCGLVKFAPAVARLVYPDLLG